MILRADSLEKLPCYVDFPHISSIALFHIYFINIKFCIYVGVPVTEDEQSSVGGDVMSRSLQQLKTDAGLIPAYCTPPNPCPVGYTGKEGRFNRNI